MPHMHWLGKDFTFTAVLPDEEGTRIPLIKIDRWNFNWQGTYAFAEPIRLPRGAWLEMEAHFDNTAENPANPHSPPKVVSWGDQTTDEMCIGIFEFVAADEGEPRGSRTRMPTPPPTTRRRMKPGPDPIGPGRTGLSPMWSPHPARLVLSGVGEADGASLRSRHPVLLRPSGGYFPAPQHAPGGGLRPSGPRAKPHKPNTYRCQACFFVFLKC